MCCSGDLRDERKVWYGFGKVTASSVLYRKVKYLR
jgi:hypothetical protein